MEKSYFKISKIDENTYNIFDPASVFCTLIIGKEKAILFDTCNGLDDLRSTVELITSLPITVFNSHGHIDHVGGNYQFDEVYIHQSEIPIAKNHLSIEMKVKQIENLKKQKIPPKFEEYYKFPEKFSEEEYLNREETTKYIPIDEGTILRLGERELEVVCISGHTPGGISLLDKHTKTLFSGDAISPFIWLHLDESTSVKACVESLYKVKRLDFKQIIASHLQQPLSKAFIDKFIACMKNIDVNKSRPFYAEIVGKKGLMYSEGGEPFKDPDFVAIVYSEDKLN